MDSGGWLQAKFATYTSSPREKKRSLSAAGAIFGVILRVCMRNILVGAAGELRFVDCRRGVRLMADFRCLDSHRISSLAPGKLDSSFWILWILLDIEPLRIQRIQRNPTIRRALFAMESRRAELSITRVGSRLQSFRRLPWTDSLNFSTPLRCAQQGRARVVFSQSPWAGNMIASWVQTRTMEKVSI